MFQPKVLIFLSIVGIGTILGFIIGVAPGYFIKSYPLLGVSAGLLFIIFLLLIIMILIFEYLDKNRTFATHISIFQESLSRHEQILLSFTCSLLFVGGAILGILCVLLLKAISAPIGAHLVITSIFILILLTILVAFLIIERRDSKKSKIDNDEPHPVIIESPPQAKILTKPQDGPKNTASRINRYRSHRLDDDQKSTWQDSTFNNSITHSTNTFKAPSTIQREYQKLLHPSSRFFVNDKVYANDDHLAEIIEVDNLGNYRIQYLDNGLIDFKNGSELRKALPLTN